MKKTYFFRAPEGGEGGGGDTALVIKKLDELKGAHATEMKAQKEAHEAEVKALKEQSEGLDTRLGETVALSKKNADALKEMEQKLATANLGGTAAKGFNEELRETYEKGMKTYKEKGGNIELQMKTAISGANFTNDTTGNTRVIQETREAGINKAPKRTPFIRPLAFNGTVTGDTISWTEKVSESGVPVALAELGAYPEETSTYEQFSMPVKKIGGMTKVAEEKLEDVEWMMNEIQSELVQRHELVVDTEVLSGSGSGNHLKGVLEYATDFAAGSFALKIPNANRADALRVAYNQVVVALFQPTFIAMHPTDIAFMELEKDANGVYLLPPFVSANGMTIKGLPVVENTGMTEGTFLIGDGSRLGVFAKGGAVLEIGRDGSDFSTDQVTVKLRERLVVRVKGRDLAAFVSGDFDTAITAITKP